MDELTEHFGRHEFECKGRRCCGHSAPIDHRMAPALEVLRRAVNDHLGRKTQQDVPLKINSGFRCNKHNRSIKDASPNSKHRFGLAADVAVPKGLTVKRFAALAQQTGLFRGIGLYDWGLHLDFAEPRTWDLRTRKD